MEKYMLKNIRENRPINDGQKTPIHTREGLSSRQPSSLTTWCGGMVSAAPHHHYRL